MGWNSGTYLAMAIWDMVREHLPVRERHLVARKLIRLFESEDCDTIDEAVVLCREAGRNRGDDGTVRYHDRGSEGFLGLIADKHGGELLRHAFGTDAWVFAEQAFAVGFREDAKIEGYRLVVQKTKDAGWLAWQYGWPRCDECGGDLGGQEIGRLENHKTGCSGFPL